MIYEFPDESEPIRQGDIFYPIPNLTIDLDQIPILDKEGVPEVKKWEELSEFPSSATIAIGQAWGIVASQDCDTARSQTISLFTISPIEITTGNKDEYKDKSAHWWMERITKKSKIDRDKWFYLPPDAQLGFSERMVVVFQNILQLQRANLDSRKEILRKGRLNKEADEHFRESIAQFFRRYPYNEWYPLNKEEFEAYAEDKKEFIPPYPWQF
jgi:hypothetical protein